MFFNISLPTLSDISDKQNTEAIRGYLATLHDQLRYMMLNIDEDNLSDNLSATINTAAESAEYSKKSILSLDEKLSSVSQTADKINWLISDGTNTSDFSLTSRAASLIANSIDLTGYVEFSDLQNSGTTVINGNNIISGTISADKLAVSDLSAVSARVGGWYLTGDSISSSVSGSGSIYFNSASSSDSFWIKAQNMYGNNTFYIAKNGACYLDGSYIGNGTITAQKIQSDSQNRLDLTNNLNGVKLGKELCITNGSVNCRIYVNNASILTFDPGTGNTPFSFALNRNGSTYSLSVLNGSGNVVGTIAL